MRRLVPIIVIAVTAVAASYYAYRQSHRVRAIEGPTLTVRVLDAEFGCAGILRTPEGRIVVIDPTLRGVKAVADLLKAEHARAVTVILTDITPARAAALAALQRSVGVSKLIRPELGPSTEVWTRTLALAKCEPTAELAIPAGDRVRVSPKVAIEALGPSIGCRGPLVFRVRFGAKSVFFSPQMDAAEESDLIRSGQDLTSSVLVAPRTGASLELLSMVRPEIIVISTPTKPSRSVLDRFSERNTGAALYRTDKHGIIEIDTNGRSVRVSTEGGGP